MSKATARGPIELAFSEYVCHNYESVQQLLRERNDPLELHERLLRLRLRSLSDRMLGRIEAMGASIDKKLLATYLTLEYESQDLSPSYEYLHSILPEEHKNATKARELLTRCHLSATTYHKWGLKKTYDLKSLRTYCDTVESTWLFTNNAYTPWTCVIGDTLLEAKLGLYPMEPLYQIFVNGKESVYVNDWPSSWMRQQSTGSIAHLTEPRVNIMRKNVRDLIAGRWDLISADQIVPFIVTGLL